MRNRRSDPPGFREVFHKGRGGRIKRTNYWKCQQCGTSNDITKTALSKSGDGLVTINEAVEATTLEVYDYALDREAKSGCKFCGSLNWANARPRKLPDSKKLPATGWKRKRI